MYATYWTITFVYFSMIIRKNQKPVNNHVLQFIIGQIIKNVLRFLPLWLNSPLCSVCEEHFQTKKLKRACVRTQVKGPKAAISPAWRSQRMRVKQWCFRFPFIKSVVISCFARAAGVFNWSLFLVRCIFLHQKSGAGHAWHAAWQGNWPTPTSSRCCEYPALDI